MVRPDSQSVKACLEVFGTSVYLRPLLLRERGLPFGRRVGFGTTLGLRFGTVRFRGAVLPGVRRARFCETTGSSESVIRHARQMYSLLDAV